MRKDILFLLPILMLNVSLFAQVSQNETVINKSATNYDNQNENLKAVEESALDAAVTENASKENKVVAIDGFDSILLKMDYQTVLSKLEEGTNFIYSNQGPTWIDENPVIAANGKGYISKGYFHFYESKLYSITIELNNSKIDYYTIFMTLQKKYGKYSAFSPLIVSWESDETILTLERPLLVRYIDKEIHDQLLEASKIKTSKAEKNRESFLEQF